MAPLEGKVIGVMGGSFNPIHLGHALLAITVHETKPVDEVILVPVFKHPVKKDLLPFEDRIAMCKLAVSASNIGVSSVEQETGESNAVMLRALRSKYPKGSRLLWVCGDDVFDWISNEKGQAMLAELDGLIVQRRLHKACDSQADRFYKAPVDSDKVRALVAEHRVHVDFIYGELPHYSSTLVRNSPASWRAFLPQKVAAYLDDRPALLAQLVRTGDAPASRVSPPASPLVVLDKNMLDDAEPGYQEDLEFEKELTDAAEIMLKTSSLELEVLEETSTSTTSTGADDVPTILRGQLSPRSHKSRTPSRTPRMPSKQRLREASTSCVMRCLATVHALQRERGHTALALALKGTPQGESAAKAMHDARAALDLLLKGDPVAERALRLSGLDAGAAGAVAEELRRTPLWLSYDRALLDRRFEEEATAVHGEDSNCWMRRASLLDKFNVRVDVLIDACTHALAESLEARSVDARPQVWSRSASYDFNDPIAKGKTCDDDRETTGEWLLLLFKQYADCKEALGRLRCFVCCGGQHAPDLVRSSFRTRRWLNEVIEHKDRMLHRVLSTEQAGPNSAEHPGASTAAALHKMLASVTLSERELMGCFARSTPLEVMHEALKAGHEIQKGKFDVHDWFRTLSSAIDLMVNLDQALAAFICTSPDGD
ncbi:unnamed protein product [Durusdinium trenchii]|uniref:Cytidyltransferase-like domain-containing protein n=2 Tax=Durusdinium trenchii TaxID=1381693 RepID=A0ABP0KNL9_9DINO